MRQDISNLIQYALDNELIYESDVIYTLNRLFNLLNIIPFNYNELPKAKKINSTFEALVSLFSYVKDNNSFTLDVFKNKVMSLFSDKPSFVQNKFDYLYRINPNKAINWYYKYMMDLYYVKHDLIKSNIVYDINTKYGPLIITINLAKPEKDPSTIKNESLNENIKYPKCELCIENEGYSNDNQNIHKENLRLIKVPLINGMYYFQYSPYSYFNHHSIVLSQIHKPMIINKNALENLIELTARFKGFFFGSNADIPIVGGSILSHDHYQGGMQILPIEKASSFLTIKHKNIDIELLNWPITTIKISSDDKKSVLNFSNLILKMWIKYNNDDLNIVSHTNDQRHNSITPIFRTDDDCKVSAYLILRNNYQTDLRPLGLFHPNSDKWHIKKENIGLIEASGLAILPARLKTELEHIKDFVLKNKRMNPDIRKHIDWINTFKDTLNNDNFYNIIYYQIGKRFEQILEDCAVFKNDELGKVEFINFVKEVIKSDK